MTKKAKILWVDLEMTGLDSIEDRIMEVAAIVTDWDFKEIAVYEAVVKVGPNLVKRRMEVIGTHDGITVYDDFAHHPTAIHTTLSGLRAKVGDARIVVAMEPRSNSMRLGAHAEALAPSLDIADAVVFLARPELPWDAGKVVGALKGEGHVVADADALIARLRAIVRKGDHVVFMSNGGFDGAPRRFHAALKDG